MGGLIKDVANAEFVNHPRDTPQMIQDVRTVRLRWWWESRPGRWSQSLLLDRGDGIATQKLLNCTWVARNVGYRRFAKPTTTGVEMAAPWLARQEHCGHSGLPPW